MADSDKDDEYLQRFIERVREVRIATGFKQWQVADDLGIRQDAYKFYESRKQPRLLPHHLMVPFCNLCRVNIQWLLTGKGPKSLQEAAVVDVGPRLVAAPKRAPSKRKAERAA